MMLSSGEAKALTDRLLARSQADACVVKIEGSDGVNLRFARGNATTNGATGKLTVRVESHFGKRAGAAQMSGEVVEIATIGGKRVGGGAALGRQHVEEQLEKPAVGREARASHWGRVVSVLFDEPIRRHRDGDLARLRLDEIGEREHGAVDEATDDSERHDQAEQARHWV